MNLSRVHSPQLAAGWFPNKPLHFPTLLNLTAVPFIFYIIVDTHQKNIASKILQDLRVLLFAYLHNGIPGGLELKISSVAS